MSDSTNSQKYTIQLKEAALAPQDQYRWYGGEDIIRILSECDLDVRAGSEVFEHLLRGEHGRMHHLTGILRLVVPMDIIARKLWLEHHNNWYTRHLVIGNSERTFLVQRNNPRPFTDAAFTLKMVPAGFINAPKRAADFLKLKFDYHATYTKDV